MTLEELEQSYGRVVTECERIRHRLNVMDEMLDEWETDDSVTGQKWWNRFKNNNNNKEK